MAKVFLDTTDTTFTVSNNNVAVFGQTGTQAVVVGSGTTGVTVDQNVESLLFAGLTSDFVFQQTGNIIQVYKASAAGNTLVATVPVQADADGTQLTFNNGTVDAKLTAGVMTLGGTTVNATSPTVVTPATINTAITTGGAGVITGQVFSLTAGIDNIVGGASNDSFTALDVSGVSSWGALDTIDGGAGSNTFTIATAGNVSQPAGATVTNIQSVVIAESGTAKNVTLNTTTGWTGLTTLQVTQGDTGTDTLTVAATTDVTNTTAAAGAVNVFGGKNVTVTTTGGNVAVGGVVGTNASPVGAIIVTDTVAAASTINVDGGSSVTITESGTTNGGVINVGANVQTKGAVAVTATTGAASTNAIGTITIKGGSTVTVTEAAGNAALTTNDVVQGNVVVTGTTDTTTVTVNQSASQTGTTAVAAVAAVAGVVAVTAAPGVEAVAAVTAVPAVAAVTGLVGASTGTVNIADKVAPSAIAVTPGGTTGGTIAAVNLTNFGATNISSPALTTLSLSGTSGAVGLFEGGVMGATNTTLTLNVNNLTASAITDNSAQFTTLNVVTGATKSTLGSFVDASLKALNVSGSSLLTVNTPTSATTVTVTGTAGYKGSIDATTTTFNAAGTSGANTITIAADATKAITGGTGTSDEVILNGAGPFTTANTSAKVTGFEILGLNSGVQATTVDASVFGAGINKIDVVSGVVTDVFTLTKVNTNAALNVSPTVATVAAITETFVDATGSSDIVAVTLGSGKTVTSLTLQDANQNAIGTLKFANSGSSAAIVDTLINGTVGNATNALSFSGAGAMTVGGAVGKFTNTATAMTIDNTGTNAAGLTVGMTDNSLGALTFTGSGKTTMTLADTVGGSLGITNSGTGNVTLNAGTLNVTTLSLTGSMNLTVTDNNLKSLTLANGQAVKLTDANNTGITISGATDNSHVELTLGAAGAVATVVDSITLGNANNKVTDASTTNIVNVTVGTGANLIDIHTGASTTYAATVTLGAHTNTATAFNQILVSPAQAAQTSNTTITGAVLGDVITFENNAAVNVAFTALSAANLAALAGNGTLGGAISAVWGLMPGVAAHEATVFVFGGDTYMVEDVAGDKAFNVGVDSVIKITGVHTAADGGVNANVSIAS